MAETPFSLVCTIQRSNVRQRKAMQESMVSESETTSIDDTQFSFDLHEANAKDLRAMWNTRIRGLIAADEILKVIQTAGSSTNSDSNEL
ncbi:hypothetical protein N9295_00055 [bacterium]|nr:hypothetical protein [Candidatus Poseidoniales archaeon]MDA8716119.1 hypothetical protein [Candidatus Poseidoniales archaeon]MDB3879224.1 hypothetical protein [bacterium]|tara:strand:- start:3816 stop:4082 length:267 start_codon:yes stop_codon:yes gene_type:complete